MCLVFFSTFAPTSSSSFKDMGSWHQPHGHCDINQCEKPLPAPLTTRNLFLLLTNPKPGSNLTSLLEPPLFTSAHTKNFFSLWTLWAPGKQFLRGQAKSNCWSVKITAWNWIWIWFYLFWLSPPSCSWLIISPFSTKFPTPAFVMWKGSYLCKGWWNHIHFPAILHQTLSSAFSEG